MPISSATKLKIRLFCPPAIVGLAIFLAFTAVAHFTVFRLMIQDLELDAWHSIGMTQEALRELIHPTSAFKAFVLGSEDVTVEEFRIFAQEILGDSHSFVNAMWVGKDDVIRHVWPENITHDPTFDPDISKYPNRFQPILDVKESRQVLVTRPNVLVTGLPGFYVYDPLFRDGEYLGTAVLLIHLDSFTNRTRDLLIGEGISMTLRSLEDQTRWVRLDTGEVFDVSGRRVLDVYGTLSEEPSPRPYSWQRLESDFVLGGGRWQLVADRYDRIAVWPNAMIATALFLLTCVIAILYCRLKWRRRHLEAALNREKDFVSLVSHQLREPMTELAWATELLQDDPQLNRDQAQKIGEIRQSVLRAAKLTDDMLNVSRIERGVLKINWEVIPARQVFEDAVGPLEEQSSRRDVRLIVDVPPGLFVCADRVKIAEAVRNVIDNALKYSPVGSSVLMTAVLAEDGEHVILSVTDHGSGISEDNQRYLFEKTKPGGKHSAGSGAGLGLYLTKMFVEMMRGTVRFETGSEGTIFFFWLRSCPPDDDAKSDEALLRS